MRRDKAKGLTEGKTSGATAYSVAMVSVSSAALTVLAVSVVAEAACFCAAAGEEADFGTFEVAHLVPMHQHALAILTKVLSC